jgi:hypothetical protein
MAQPARPPNPARSPAATVLRVKRLNLAARLDAIQRADKLREQRRLVEAVAASRRRAR